MGRGWIYKKELREGGERGLIYKKELRDGWKRAGSIYKNKGREGRGWIYKKDVRRGNIKCI